MKSKKQRLNIKFLASSILIITVLVLAACNGAITFKGSAKPNNTGGVDITGGVQQAAPAQPNTAPQTTSGTGLDQTTIILIGVGIAFFILILVLIVSRGRSNNQPPS